MSAAAGAVLGPRPGLAIVSFSQGIVEIILRVVAIVVGAIPVLIAGAISFTNDILTITVPPGVPGKIIDNSTAAAGYAIGIAGMAILIELLFLLLRFLNIGIINIKITIFLIADIAFSVLFALAFLAAGVVMAIFAQDWDDALALIRGFLGVPGLPIDIPTIISQAEDIRTSLAVGAAFSFLALILFAALAVWMIIFMVKKWNTKVVKYTLKEAATG